MPSRSISSPLLLFPTRTEQSLTGAPSPISRVKWKRKKGDRSPPAVQRYSFLRILPRGLEINYSAVHKSKLSIAWFFRHDYLSSVFQYIGFTLRFLNAGRLNEHDERIEREILADSSWSKTTQLPRPRVAFFVRQD